MGVGFWGVENRALSVRPKPVECVKISGNGCKVEVGEKEEVDRKGWKGLSVDNRASSARPR